uniref:Uncharacterized protein n=1 Tax=Strongyloides venezuelensis TaxID=75913 RepID=A0A0K0F5K9_STRVS
MLKVKLGLNVDCSSFRGECNYCFREKRFFLSVKQHTTVAFGTIRYRDKLSHSIDILKAFKNLSVLHLKFGLNSVINNFMASYNPKFRGFGLRKLKILKDVKLEYEKDLDDHDSDMLNSFYQFFEFICSMMPRNVEVL